MVCLCEIGRQVYPTFPLSVLFVLQLEFLVVFFMVLWELMMHSALWAGETLLIPADE